MERDVNRHHSESLVRQLTEERERFVSAWQSGARTPELNKIRQNIQQLNDLLWQSTLRGVKPENESMRDTQSRLRPTGNRP
jgi:hypothetical protein